MCRVDGKPGPSACAVGVSIAPRHLLLRRAGLSFWQGELDTSSRPADEAAGWAALQWVPGSEMQAKGLTSGVKKVCNGVGGRLQWRWGARPGLQHARQDMQAAVVGQLWFRWSAPPASGCALCIASCPPMRRPGVQALHRIACQGHLQAAHHAVLQASGCARLRRSH